MNAHQELKNQSKRSAIREIEEVEDTDFFQGYLKWLERKSIEAVDVAADVNKPAAERDAAAGVYVFLKDAINYSTRQKDALKRSVSDAATNH